MSSLEAIQKQLQAEVGKFNEVQRKLQKLIKDRELLDGQLNENKSVHEELQLIKDGGKVFSLIGPALIEQMLPDARKNVSERINFISDKIKSLDTNIADLEKEANKHRESLNKLSQSFKMEKA